MGTGSIRTIGVRNTMTLQCGSSAAVDALNSKRDEIKNALAQGKDAMADLESKAAEALSALEAVKVPIPSVAIPNLQEDINSVVSGLTSGLDISNPLSGASALTSLPGKIAEFTSTWSSVLPANEIQSYVDTMTSTVTNAVTDPTSLLDFDPCKQFPNKIIETAPDGTQKEAVKAPAVETPTVNATKPEESAAPVQTVTAHEDIQPDKKPSTLPHMKASDRNYFTIMKEFNAYADQVIEIKNTHHQAETDVVSIKIEEFELANEALEDEIADLEISTGLSIKQLEEQGKFPEHLTKYIDEYDAMIDEYGVVDARVAAIEVLMMGYKGTFTGELAMKDFKPTEDSFNAGGIYGDISDTDIAIWAQIKALMDANKQNIIDYEQHRNVRKPRPAWSLGN